MADSAPPLNTPLTAGSSTPNRGIVLIVLAAALWGTVGIATKALYSISDTNPLTVGFFRLAFSVPALTLACWYVTRRLWFASTARDLGLMAGLGVAMAAYQVFYFAAIAQVGVTIAVLVTLCSAPVIVGILAVVFLREQMTIQVGVALVAALAGTVLLVNSQPDDATVTGSLVLGVALAAGAGLSYSSVVLFSRTLADRYHPLQPIMVGFAIGAVLLLPFALIGGLVLTYSLQGWLLLLHLGIIPTALGYLLFLSGLRSTPATVASIATLIEPLTSAVLAWVLFGERLGPLGIAGGVLLLGAMLMLSVRRG
ncbi:MAG: EamA family transporter [Chloroflexaceae bacterium]|nr:EamA family transporter [Chloroflexaceae bacterium]